MERLTISGTKEAKPDVTIREVLNKLAEYEDLEERGNCWNCLVRWGIRLGLFLREKFLNVWY